MMQLPPELWYRVIGLATDLDRPSRPGFEDHLLPPFSKDSLREKWNIYRISRSFREISLQFLNEFIVVDTPDAFQSLRYTLVHCPTANDFASRVRMLPIMPERLVNTQFPLGLSEAITQIFENTTKLRAFYVQETYEGQITGEHVDFFAPRIPSSVTSISWQVICEDETSKNALQRAISS